MRIAVRDFTANPSNDLVIAYEQANSLDSIESGLNRRNSDAIATLHNKVLGLKRRSRILCTNRTRVSAEAHTAEQRVIAASENVSSAQIRSRSWPPRSVKSLRKPRSIRTWRNLRCRKPTTPSPR